MKKLFLLLSMVALTPVAAASADISITQKYVENLALTGKASFRYLFWDVYDAELFTPNGTYEKGKPLALKLSYKRSLKGAAIAKRSIEEMRGIGLKDEGKISSWLQQMENIFPNVEEGVSITGIATASGKSIFYKNEQRIGQIEDPEFTKWFFGIWLNEKTSQPELRKRLIGYRDKGNNA